MVTKKTTLLLLTAVITLYYISFFVGTLTQTTEASESCTVPVHVQQYKPWKNWENYDPQWEQFQEDHPQYEYQETEIYRGTRRSVNRFYSKR